MLFSHLFGWEVRNYRRTSDKFVQNGQLACNFQMSPNEVVKV